MAQLAVTPGEHVSAGTPLCTLTDHCVLYVEGKAFDAAVRTTVRSVCSFLHLLHTCKLPHQGETSRRSDDLDST